MVLLHVDTKVKLLHQWWQRPDVKVGDIGIIKERVNGVLGYWSIKWPNNNNYFEETEANLLNKQLYEIVKDKEMRKFKAGDRVKLVAKSNPYGDFKTEPIATLESTAYENCFHVKWEDPTIEKQLGSRYCYVEHEIFFELLESNAIKQESNTIKETVKQEFKEGVRVELYNSSGNIYPNCLTGTKARLGKLDSPNSWLLIFENGKYANYYVTSNTPEKYWRVIAEENKETNSKPEETNSKPEETKSKREDFKPGVRVELIDNQYYKFAPIGTTAILGDLLKYSGQNNHLLIWEDEKLLQSNNNTWCTTTEPEKYWRIIPQIQNTQQTHQDKLIKNGYKTGTRVRLFDNTHIHSLPIGTIAILGEYVSDHCGYYLIFEDETLKKQYPKTFSSSGIPEEKWAIVPEIGTIIMPPATLKEPVTLSKLLEAHLENKKLEDKEVEGKKEETKMTFKEGDKIRLVDNTDNIYPSVPIGSIAIVGKPYIDGHAEICRYITFEDDKVRKLYLNVRVVVANVSAKCWRLVNSEFKTGVRVERIYNDAGFQIPIGITARLNTLFGYNNWWLDFEDADLAKKWDRKYVTTDNPSKFWKVIPDKAAENSVKPNIVIIPQENVFDINNFAEFLKSKYDAITQWNRHAVLDLLTHAWDKQIPTWLRDYHQEYLNKQDPEYPLYLKLKAKFANK